jgi:hypothetical protein
MPTDANLDEELERAAGEWRREVDGLFGTIDWSRHSHRRGLRALYESARWRLVTAGAIAVVAVAVTLAVVLGQPDAPAHRGPAVDCAAPTLTVHRTGAAPVTVTPGQTLTVLGRFWVDGCRDDVRGTLPPLIHQVRVVLETSDGRAQALAVAHPHGDEGTFKIDVTIPRDSPAGRATLDDAAGRSLAAIKLQIAR